MKRLLAITLVSATAAQAALTPPESVLKASISSSELDAQLGANSQRATFLKAELSKKVSLLNQLQNGASVPVYLWEDVPVTQRNRASIEKILKLAVRRHLDEIARIQQINAELTSQLDWMSHEVTGAKPVAPTTTEIAKGAMPAIKENAVAEATNFHCGDVPVSFTSLSEKPILQDFGTRKDALTGLEWNSLGWWIGQKPASHVRACLKGKVVFSGPMQGRGHVVMIDHGDDFLTIYANLVPNANVVKLGASLRTGEVVGNSQDSLYFEVRHKGKAVNPRLVFARQNLDILGL
ncbi:MAG TPA: M23 family metallopeptidase [Bdellovibrionota bacterium]|nr:M23 family metallopeptidase [Bdellovibrionota bacterium]